MKKVKPVIKIRKCFFLYIIQYRYFIMWPSQEANIIGLHSSVEPLKSILRPKSLYRFRRC